MSRRIRTGRVDAAIAPVVEAMEQRCLLSISVIGNVLTVDDSARSQRRDIVIGFDSLNSEYTVTDTNLVNGNVDSNAYPTAGIDSFSVIGSSGSNTIEIDATQFPNLDGMSTIQGGQNPDTITGSDQGHEVINGANGPDSILSRGPHRGARPRFDSIPVPA